MTDTRFIAIILAAGRGERTGLNAPKQWAMLGNRPVICWSIDVMTAHPACAATIVVVPDGGLPPGIDVAPSVIQVVGGATRQQSVAQALTACQTIEASHILVHDAARPGLSPAMVDRLLSAFMADKVAGAIPVLPVTDTIITANADDGTTIGANVDRSLLRRVQTPQAFCRAWLIRAHDHSDQASNHSDDAQMVRAVGGRVVSVAGDPLLEKITLPGDLAMLEAVLNADDTPLAGLAPAHKRGVRHAVGNGFDVHRLVAGDGVWLCGVLIPSMFSLLGHSDADVGLHAMTDALLGAIGNGDIGTHFPPSDPQWQGAASDRFLAHAATLVRAAGGTIQHIDCTILCETPKVGPYRDAMRQRVADILAIPVNWVSIKATTTERLGFTGRGEGIAAQATASVAIQDI